MSRSHPGLLYSIGCGIEASQSSARAGAERRWCELVGEFRPALGLHVFRVTPTPAGVFERSGLHAGSLTEHLQSFGESVIG